jgi:hypothetical protein
MAPENQDSTSMSFGRKTPFDFWTYHFAALADAGLATAVQNPLRGDTFIDVTIEGVRFIAAVTTHGPYIGDKLGTGSCQMGVASINYCDGFFRSTGERWYVCKYNNQSRIDLSRLSDAGRRALAYEFGIPIVHNCIEAFFQPTEVAFYASKAFAALCSWAAAHPKKIRRFERNAYLGDWPKAALSGIAADAFGIRSET